LFKLKDIGNSINDAKYIWDLLTVLKCQPLPSF
jgi:hypothetical protein